MIVCLVIISKNVATIVLWAERASNKRLKDSYVTNGHKNYLLIRGGESEVCFLNQPVP